jgi:phosphohistidine phosphatase
MARHALIPDRAVVSPAARARETWELAATALANPPPVAFENRLYEANPQTMLQVAKETPAVAHALLMVGHNPAMHELALLLIAAGEVDLREQVREKFPTCGLAVIDFAVDDWSKLHPRSGRLDRFVTPRSLASATE